MKISLIVFILVAVTLSSDGLAVQFVFTPSPNIGVYQLAHYQCLVDHTGVTISWYVNEKAIGHNELGIVIRGGSQQSNLTMYGYSQYNNTVVKCLASGFVNGKIYFEFDNATLRIQGQLAAVNNLICHVQSQYINCYWSLPFSLVSIPGYIINVTYGGELVAQNTTSSTTWQFCPSQFGTYTISVAGNNSAGEGEISNTSVIVPEDEITNQLMTGLSPISTITSTPSTSSKTINIMSPSSTTLCTDCDSSIMSPSSTTLCIDCDNMDNVKSDHVIIIILVATIVTILLVLAILIVGVMCVVFNQKNRKWKWIKVNERKPGSLDEIPSTQFNQNNYAYVTSSSDGPIAPPNPIHMHSVKVISYED